MRSISVPAPIGKTVRLSDETTPSQDIGWTPKIISGIIRTERYCGDVILQKTYTPDFLSHRSVKNRGELPRYLALDHHPAIISRGQFAKAQELVILNRRLYTRENTLKRYPLSGRIICGSCGRRYNLLTNRSEPVWWCPYSRLNYGKRVCHAVKITADELAVAIKTAVLERFLSAGEGMKSSDFPSADCPFSDCLSSSCPLSDCPISDPPPTDAISRAEPSRLSGPAAVEQPSACQTSWDRFDPELLRAPDYLSFERGIYHAFIKEGIDIHKEIDLLIAKEWIRSNYTD